YRAFRLEHTAPAASSPVAAPLCLRERLARQVAGAALLHDDVVLDPDAAERAQRSDRVPVEQAAAIVALERREQRVDHVDAGLDGEHLAGLDHRGVAQELVL